MGRREPPWVPAGGASEERNGASQFLTRFQITWGSGEKADPDSEGLGA